MFLHNCEHRFIFQRATTFPFVPVKHAMWFATEVLRPGVGVAFVRLLIRVNLSNLLASVYHAVALINKGKLGTNEPFVYTFVATSFNITTALSCVSCTV